MECKSCVNPNCSDREYKGGCDIDRPETEIEKLIAENASLKNVVDVVRTLPLDELFLERHRASGGSNLFLVETDKLLAIAKALNRHDDSKETTVRCPECQGMKVLIDRFDHGKSVTCAVCKGKGRIRKDAGS